MAVKELYTPTVIGINSFVIVGGANIGGFIAKTAGTITVTDASGALIIDAIPLTAGVYTPLPFTSERFRGARVQLAGGASGVLAT